MKYGTFLLRLQNSLSKGTSSCTTSVLSVTKKTGTVLDIIINYEQKEEKEETT